MVCILEGPFESASPLIEPNPNRTWITPLRIFYFRQPSSKYIPTLFMNSSFIYFLFNYLYLAILNAGRFSLSIYYYLPPIFLFTKYAIMLNLISMARILHKLIKLSINIYLHLFIIMFLLLFYISNLLYYFIYYSIIQNF